jgi:hypothetical protein
MCWETGLLPHTVVHCHQAFCNTFILAPLFLWSDFFTWKFASRSCSVSNLMSIISKIVTVGTGMTQHLGRNMHDSKSTSKAHEALHLDTVF